MVQEGHLRELHAAAHRLEEQDADKDRGTSWRTSRPKPGPRGDYRRHEQHQFELQLGELEQKSDFSARFALPADYKYWIKTTVLIIKYCKTTVLIILERLRPPLLFRTSKRPS